MTRFDSAELYLQSKTTIQAKIVAIDAIISSLEMAALKSASSGDLTEYTLNDGQTSIKTVLRGADSIFTSINAFERLKQMYINRLNGRVSRLVDSKNFRGNGCF